MHKHTDRVEQVFNAIKHDLGTLNTLEAVRGLVECQRNKPLLIETDNLPLSVSGYVVALKDCDLICTRRQLDWLRSQAACLHEMSHLLLDHIPLLSSGGDTLSYAEYIQSRDAHAVLYRAQGGAYDSPGERDAETLMTLLLDWISQRKSGLPELATKLHGES